MFRSQMSLIVYTAFFILLEPFSGFGKDANDDDTTSNTYAKEEYDHIFKSIPILFEQFFTVLDDRPQVLEQANADAFNDFHNTIADEKTKRDVDLKRPCIKGLLDKESLKNDKIKGLFEPNGFRALEAITDEKLKGDVDLQETPIKSLFDDGNFKSDVIAGLLEPNGFKALAANDDDIASEDDVTTIDPGDVEEQALLLENELEEYNDD